jgi:hypothetical protein
MPRAFSGITYSMSNLYAEKCHFTGKTTRDQPRSFASFVRFLVLSKGKDETLNYAVSLDEARYETQNNTVTELALWIVNPTSFLCPSRRWEN